MPTRYSCVCTNISTIHSYVWIICVQDIHMLGPTYPQAILILRSTFSQYIRMFVSTRPQYILIFGSTYPQRIHMFVPTYPKDFRSVSLTRFQSTSSLMIINYLKSQFRWHTNRLPLNVPLRQVRWFLITNVMWTPLNRFSRQTKVLSRDAPSPPPPQIVASTTTSCRPVDSGKSSNMYDATVADLDSTRIIWLPTPD